MAPLEFPKKSLGIQSASGLKSQYFESLQLQLRFLPSSRANLYTPPPPPTPISGHEAFFREGGGGVYFEAPRGRNFIRPPLLYTPHP